MYILPVERFAEAGTFPLETTVFEEKLENICAESRHALIKGWLPRCADIFLELRSYWKEYIPKRQGDSLSTIENFFNCINGVMAMQLRSLVMRSLKHFLNFMIRFKVFIKLLVGCSFVIR